MHDEQEKSQSIFRGDFQMMNHKNRFVMVTYLSAYKFKLFTIAGFNGDAMNLSREIHRTSCVLWPKSLNFIRKKKIPVFRKINYYLLVNFLIPRKPSLCGAALNVIWIYQSEEKCVLKIDCRKFYNHRIKSPAEAILSHTQARNRWCRNVYSDAKHCIKIEIASNTSTIWTRWHRHGDIVGLANKSRWFKSEENWIHNIETISETKRHVINDGKTAQWNDMMVVVVNENDTHVHAI